MRRARIRRAGDAVAAISVAGPETAFGADADSRSRTEQVILQAARDLSSLLGSRGYPPAG